MGQVIHWSQTLLPLDEQWTHTLASSVFVASRRYLFHAMSFVLMQPSHAPRVLIS